MAVYSLDNAMRDVISVIAHKLCNNEMFFALAWPQGSPLAELQFSGVKAVHRVLVHPHMLYARYSIEYQLFTQRRQYVFANQL